MPKAAPSGRSSLPISCGSLQRSPCVAPVREKFSVAKEPADMPEHPNDMTVHFRSDGVALPPADYSRLLGRLAEERGIAADEFSRGGVVGELEERMAGLLGKEMAVFLPSGTLANHLALRLLATRGHRVLVQRE